MIPAECEHVVCVCLSSPCWARSACGSPVPKLSIRAEPCLLLAWSLRQTDRHLNNDGAEDDSLLH